MIRAGVKSGSKRPLARRQRAFSFLAKPDNVLATTPATPRAILALRTPAGYFFSITCRAARASLCQCVI